MPDYPAIRRFIQTGNPGRRVQPTPAEAGGPIAPTPRQLDVFVAMYESARDLGHMPTIQELMDRFGAGSPNGIACHLRALLRKGWIGKSPSAHRSYLLLRRPDGSPFSGFLDKD